MKHLGIIIASFFLFSCSSSTQDKKTHKNTPPTQSKDTLKAFPTVKFDPCETTPLILDTTTELQNQLFEPEKDIINYKTVAVHVTNGKGEMGYIVLGNGNKLILCLVDWQEEHRIIGTTNIPNLKDNEQFVDLCESNCDGFYKTFGVVTEIKYGDIKTIRAWRVNNKARQLEEIKPTSVNCIESFYTDYD
jgi:hypothetical protein